MQIIIIIFYCFKEQNFWNILLPRALEDIEDHKVTEGTETSFSISHTHSYGYPKSNWKCKRESWKTKLRDNRMHLNSFVHGQKYISFSSVYLIHIYTTFPPEKKKYMKIVENSLFFSAATSTWNHKYVRNFSKNCYIVPQRETTFCLIICQAAGKIYLEYLQM